MRKVDPAAVLLHLAKTLDVPATLDHFPGLSSTLLSRILAEAAGPVAGELFTKDPAPASGHRLPARVHAGSGQHAILHIDGGARGNPGPAGIGAVLTLPGKAPVGRGEFIGEATNNTAEYRALLLGLSLARLAGVRKLAVFSDSELLVRQMSGSYKVKHPELRLLHGKAHSAASLIGSVTYAHVPRAKNEAADRLVNLAIDARGPVTL